MREKIVLIGAGSAMFTRGLVADLICSNREVDLALVDTGEEPLAVAEGMCRKMIALRNSPITLTASTDRRDVLGGATAIICTVGVGGRRGWEQDVFIPREFEALGDSDVPLFVHFQGGVTIAEENFVRMRRRGVLIASKLKGRSSAFSKPYEDPEAFRALLNAGQEALSRRANRPMRFGPIVITFFSAGYGAVRELLKEPEFFEQGHNECTV